MSIYARFYDFCVPHTDELPLLLELARRSGGACAGTRVLEFGSGTGRLVAPLAGAGCEVVGVERDPAMLAISRKRVAALPGEAAARVRLIDADFARPPIEGVDSDSFDLVVLSSNTLCLMPTAVLQDSALATACAALRPGGWLFLEQVFVPGFVSQAFRERETLHIETRDNPATGSRTARFMSFLHDPVRQILIASTFLDEIGDTGSRRYEYQERLRYNHVAELVLRLRLAGFGVPEVFGGPDRRALTPNCLKFIAIAEKE